MDSPNLLSANIASISYLDNGNDMSNQALFQHLHIIDFVQFTLSIYCCSFIWYTSKYVRTVSNVNVSFDYNEFNNIYDYNLILRF